MHTFNGPTTGPVANCSGDGARDFGNGNGNGNGDGDGDGDGDGNGNGDDGDRRSGGDDINAHPANPGDAFGAAADTTRTSDSAVNFTVHSASSPLGPWSATTMVIQGWNTSWNLGNWNPAPAMLPDGSVRVMAHTSYAPWAGEVILEAPSWKGPYKVVGSVSTTLYSALPLPLPLPLLLPPLVFFVAYSSRPCTTACCTVN